MAQNVVINGVTYSNVPSVQIPKSGGGTASFYDTSPANASAGDLLSGKTAYGSSGEIIGSMTDNGSTGGTISTKAGTVVIPSGYTSGGTVSLDSSAVADLVASYILNGKMILGVTGTLTSATVSQDGVTKILSIS